MKTFAIYKITTTPNVCLETMLGKYPTPAEYSGYYLFAETHESLTGIPASEVVDIASLGFENETGLTKEALDVMIDDLISSTPRGREIQLNPQQAKYLIETKLKT